MKEASESTVSTAELAEQYRDAGNEAAFTELFKREEEDLLRYFLRKTHNNNVLAEDLINETFMKVLHGLHSFNSSQKFEPWLFRIARNVFIDHTRKKAREFCVDQGILLDTIAAPVNQQEFSSEDSLFEGKELCAYRIAWSQLGIEYRNVMLKRHVSEQEVSDIAISEGKSEQTIKNRLSSARIKFKTLLERQEVV